MKPVLTALAIAFASHVHGVVRATYRDHVWSAATAAEAADQQQAPATQTTAIQPSNKALPGHRRSSDRGECERRGEHPGKACCRASRRRD